MKILFVISVLCTSLYVESLLAVSIDKRIFLTQAFQQVVSLPDFNLNTLRSSNLVHEIDGVYQFSFSTNPIDENEMMSAQQFVERTGLQVLLLSGACYFQTLPGVDAIVFDDKGLPAANLEIKSTKPETINRATSFRNLFGKAVGAINKLTPDYIAGTVNLGKGCGFDANLSPDVINYPLEKTYLNAADKILGFVTPEKTIRPTWLLINNIGDTKSIAIEKVSLNQDSFRSSDESIIKFMDSRIFPNDDTISITQQNLKELQQTIGVNPQLEILYLFTAKQTLTVEADAYKLTENWYNNQCQRYLGFSIY